MVRELDGKFEKEQHNVALIVDNCPAHTEIGGLESVQILFLPPNATFLLQPMDQEVIRSLKAKYQTEVAEKMIDTIDNDKFLPTISIIEAIEQLILAWDDVPTTAVQNGYKKLVFLMRKKTTTRTIHFYLETFHRTASISR